MTCSFTDMSDSHQNEWSKALIDLSDEICILKQIEMVTAINDCNVSEPTSVIDSLKLFLTVVESTSTTIGEVFTLLHPATLRDASSFDTIRSLPTCCEGERSLLVRCCSFVLMDGNRNRYRIFVLSDWYFCMFIYYYRCLLNPPH